MSFYSRCNTDAKIRSTKNIGISTVRVWPCLKASLRLAITQIGKRLIGCQNFNWMRSMNELADVTRSREVYGTPRAVAPTSILRGKAVFFV